MTVEWLDGEDADELPPPPPVGPGRRRALWIGGAAAVVALGAGIAVSQSGGDGRPVAQSSSALPSTSAPPTTPPVPGRTAGPPESSAPLTSAPTGPRVSEVGHHILGATSNWELFARGDSAIIRIEMEAGRIQTTSMPALASGGGVSFVVGPSSVILRPYDAVDGYVVRDGQAPKVLAGLLARSGTVYAGPTPRQVWVEPDSTGLTTPTPRLYDLSQDRPVGTAPTAPQEFGQPFIADGSGYLLYSGVDGIYDVRPDGVHRVTTGALAAVGSKAWLVQECDDSFRCNNVLIDQASGSRRVLGPARANFNYEPGSISPDGRYAAYVTVVVGGGRPTVHVVDLVSGTDSNLDLAPSDAAYGTNPFVWDPDNGNLLVVDDQQTIRVIDPATRKVGSLGIELPPVDQIALRPATD